MKEITEEKVKTRIGEIQEDYEKIKKDKDKKYFEEQKNIEWRMEFQVKTMEDIVMKIV